MLCGSTNRILVLTKNNRILLYAPQRNEPTADSSLPFQYHDETVPSPFFDQHFDPLYSESINLM